MPVRSKPVSSTIRGWAAGLTVLLFGQACGISALRVPATVTPERMPSWQETGGIAVGAETSTEVSAQDAVLGAWVLVESRSPGPVTLRRHRITLELPDGIRLDPVGPADAAGPAPQDAGGGAGAAAMCVFGLLPLCAVGLVIILAGLASVAASPAADTSYEARVREFEAKSFPGTAVLRPGERAQGFVFFRTPPTATRAVVVNMAGAPSPRPHVLHLEIEDGAEGPPGGLEPDVRHLRLRLHW
jgi:hypothetical protein